MDSKQKQRRNVTQHHNSSTGSITEGFGYHRKAAHVKCSIHPQLTRLSGETHFNLCSGYFGGGESRDKWLLRDSKVQIPPASVDVPRCLPVLCGRAVTKGELNRWMSMCAFQGRGSTTSNQSSNKAVAPDKVCRQRKEKCGCTM